MSPDSPRAGGASPPPYVVRGPVSGQGETVDAILRALPAWFGIEAAVVDYAHAAADLPTFVATTCPTAEGDTQGVETPDGAIGFVSLRPTSECAVEIHVMAVRAEWHRAGVGRSLVERAAAYARAQGHEFLHVKTLAASDPDPGYAATRAFYAALGFRPLEVLPQVWGPENPCLLLVKVL